MSSAAENDSDFELNLAPIIDCFTVLIVFLLMTASFVSLSILDVQVATNSDAPPPPEQAVEPPDLVAIELGPNNQIDIVITGKNNIRFQIPASGPGQWDFIRMSSEIEKLKARWPKLEEVNVKSDPTIEYKQVIRVIENLKKVIPKVFLGE